MCRLADWGSTAAKMAFLLVPQWRTEHTDSYRSVLELLHKCHTHLTTVNVAGPWLLVISKAVLTETNQQTTMNPQEPQQERPRLPAQIAITRQHSTFELHNTFSSCPVVQRNLMHFDFQFLQRITQPENCWLKPSAPICAFLHIMRYRDWTNQFLGFQGCLAAGNPHELDYTNRGTGLLK